MAAAPLSVVFGAAGGIGSAAAECFVERGCTVLGVDGRTPKHPADKVDFLAHRVDRADHQAFAEILQLAIGPFHHVVIAIGGALSEEVVLDDAVFVNRRPDLLAEALRSNVVETIEIINGMLPLLADDGSASITIASSINAMGDFGYPYYSTSKAALEGYIKSSARSLGSRGVRINAVSYGTVLTERSKELHVDDPSHYQRLEALAATGRLTTAREAGVAMACLALDLTNVTGTVLVCDGGQSIPGSHSIP